MGIVSSFLTAPRATPLVGALLVLLGASGSISGAAAGDRQALQEKYRRPSEIPFSKDDPYSEAKLKLGRMLFFDPILSGSQSRSCASCHLPGLSWTDGRPRAIGEKQEELPLRTPTLLNVAWIPKLGWDGHFRDLEGVAMGPITSPTNMKSFEDSPDQAPVSDPGLCRSFRRGIRRRRHHDAQNRIRARHL